MDTPTPTTPPIPPMPKPTSAPPSKDSGPKKYIRTFEGDMEAFKKGETPNLTPLKKPPPSPSPTPIPTRAPISVPPPTPVQAPPPIPPMIPSTLAAPFNNITAPVTPTAHSGIGQMPEEYIRTYEGDMAAFNKGETPNLIPLKKPTPIPTPIQTPSPVQPPVRQVQIPEPLPIPTQLHLAREPVEEEKPSPLQTYAGDFSQRMKETHASTATVLAAEQDALSGDPQSVPEKSSRENTLYIIAGVVLLLLGTAGSYFAYTHYLIKVEPIIIAPSAPTPIPVDEKEKISGTSPAEIFQGIEQSVSHTLAPNTVRLLSTDLSTTTGNSVFSALQLPAPGILLRNINAPKSMAGVINDGGTQSPFFILSVASYSNTFAGMLSWEKTMPRDMSNLFPPFTTAIVPIPIVATTTPPKTSKNKSTAKIATSTPPAPVFVPSFHDEVVSNHDVRIYSGASGRSVLLYGYWNQTTLIIARDSSAFLEIIERLTTAHTK